MDKDLWEAVSPLLDRALDLDAGARAVLLSEIQHERPDLATVLGRLLEEHDRLLGSDFLESSPSIERESIPSLAGQTIGPYTLDVPLGMGGMGSVWRAQRSDGRFKGVVAVKLLNLALISQRGDERFRREGTLLARLSHPHIARLLDAGVTAAGQPYLVLEYVDGKPIDQFADERRLSLRRRLDLFLQVADAVAYAHASLIVHRDLKPSNILVRADDEIKLLDFGIGRLIEDEPRDGTEVTVGAGHALTPEYAAPEQITGGAISTATDLYSLGVLLYLLLTGQHPAGGSRSTADLVRAIVESVPPRPSKVVVGSVTEAAQRSANASARATTPEKLSRTLSGDLDTIVATALKKDPKERYASVTALAEDIRRYLRHQPIGARPDTFTYRAAKFVRRNRALVALAVLAVVASIAGLSGTLIQARTARVQRDFALRQLSRAEAINDLNSFLLSDAAPSGKPFTVNDLLARAERIVARQTDVDEAIRVELLVSIGRQYWSQDDDKSARRVLEQAYVRTSTIADGSTRAKAACALASELARAGELPRAEALIQEGLSALSDEPQFALDRVFCLLRGSEVAREQGASQEAIARVRDAQHRLQQLPYRSQLLELRVFMQLAESYRSAGRSSEASDAFERASAILESLGRDDTQSAGTLFNNWGIALWDLGRPLEAERIFRRAIDISRADQTEQAVSPMLLVNYARALRDLGKLDEAADYAERGYARARESGYQVLMNQSLLLRESIYRGRGELDRAAAMLAEVEPRLRRDLPAGHIAFASLMSKQALLAQARGNLEIALGLANQSVSAAEASINTGGQGAEYLPDFLLIRSDLERVLQHPDRAASDADRAIAMLRAASQPGTFSITIGRAYLAQGRAMHAQSRRHEARAAFRSALDHFHNAAGPDHLDTRTSRELVGEDIRPH